MSVAHRVKSWPETRLSSEQCQSLDRILRDLKRNLDKRSIFRCETCDWDGIGTELLSGRTCPYCGEEARYVIFFDPDSGEIVTAIEVLDVC